MERLKTSFLLGFLQLLQKVTLVLLPPANEKDNALHLLICICLMSELMVF